MHKSRTIMIQGTGSHVGKSMLVCALCRILAQAGYRVAPFKAQNMALNSFVTRDGKEMGRAQVFQAEAAGVEPMVEMNPVLLKPTGDCGSQVIVMGKHVGNMNAREYYREKNRFVSVIQEAYGALQDQFDIIVIEGAGSPAEINLKDNDIVNMGMAKKASAPVLLVTDIDRGGAFAWVVGTLELLTADERDMVKGVVFNKFRGDKEILQPGLDMLQERIHKPIIGVIPYIQDISLDDEDSVSLEYMEKSYTSGRSGLNLQPEIIDIVVIKLPRISNFTDFAILTREHNVSVRFVDRVVDIGKPDLVIIPGTKNTIEDLVYMNNQGISDEIVRLSKNGTMIIGICGGFQMLGKWISDPYSVESSRGYINAMGLLNTVTTLAREKRTYQVKARMMEHIDLFHLESELVGYEIHMGETAFAGNSLRPFAIIKERMGEKVDVPDGGVSVEGNVIGTYIHGIFDNDEFRSKLINFLKRKKGIQTSEGKVYFKDIKEHQFNRLAKIVRENMSVDMIYNILNL